MDAVENKWSHPYRSNPKTSLFKKSIRVSGYSWTTSIFYWSKIINYSYLIDFLIFKKT